MMDTKNNTLNENYDSSSILGGDDFMTSGTMSPMPMGKVQQSKTSSSSQNAMMNQTVLAIVKMYAMSLLSQLTLENAKNAVYSAKSTLTEGGFLSIRAFSVPKQGEILSRVQGNVKAFWGPYGLIFGGVALYSVISSPILLLSLFTLLAVYLFLFKIHAGQTVKIGDHTCDATQKTMFFGILSVLIFVFSGFLSYMISIVIYGACIVFIHAALHKPVVPAVRDGASPDPDSIPLTGPATV